MNENTKLFHDILEEIKQELEGNFRIEVSDEDGYFSLRLVKTFESNIKEKIANYKRNLDLLDDCIFVDVLDELPTSNIDIKHCRLDNNGRFIEEIDSGLNNCLGLEANIDQTGRAFIQDTVMN